MKWNLSYLFNTYEDFLKALNSLNDYVAMLASFEGKLNVEENFVKYLKLSRDFEINGSRVYQYASLKSDLNKKDVSALADLNKVRMVIYQLSEVVSYADPEILSIGKDTIMSFIDNNSEISEFRFIMEKLFHQNEHVLSGTEEKLLSFYSPLTSVGAELYSSLAVGDNVDDEITLTSGEKIKVTQGNYRALIADSKTEEDRKNIFEAIFKKYEKNKNTYATIYKSVLDADKAYSKARNYQNSLEAHLFNNNIPVEVYHNLVDVASNNNDSVKKYFQLIKKYLGLSKYHTYDRFLELANSDKKYSYEEAKDLFFASIDKFPEDFKNKARDVLSDGFVDVYESEGKRTGAYSSEVPNCHPFILLNHDNTLDSVFTLAHESGHSIHSMYACESQPAMLQDYTIFVAEIASTFNEHNLLDYFIASGNATREEKIMVIQKAIDNIVATFYRQTLFAEFELRAHNLNEQDQPINYDVLSNIMIDLYKKYYNIDIKDEEVKQYVWAYIPHMYYTPFYVYQYATSFAASFKLYKDVKNNVPGAFDRYINLLKAGGSKYPMQETLEAGVDFTKKDAFMAVVERIDELVAELELLLSE